MRSDDDKVQALHAKLSAIYRPVADANTDAIIDKPVAIQAHPPLVATPWKWVDPTDTPPREFLYGTHYIRQFLSAGFGAPGGGKSTKRMVEAIAMVTGRPLLGQTAKGLVLERGRSASGNRP
jgi:hypothetical protein